jgi:hypothetical protein
MTEGGEFTVKAVGDLGQGGGLGLQSEPADQRPRSCLRSTLARCFERRLAHRSAPGTHAPQLPTGKGAWLPGSSWAGPSLRSLPPPPPGRRPGCRRRARNDPRLAPPPQTRRSVASRVRSGNRIAPIPSPSSARASLLLRDRRGGCSKGRQKAYVPSAPAPDSDGYSAPVPVRSDPDRPGKP